MSAWRIEVEFDSLEVQAAKDPENGFPGDDVSRTVAFISREWALCPEELQEIAQWTDTTLVIESEIIDAFDEVLHHLVMGTSPKKIIVERTGE